MDHDNSYLISVNLSLGALSFGSGVDGFNYDEGFLNEDFITNQIYTDTRLSHTSYDYNDQIATFIIHLYKYHHESVTVTVTISQSVDWESRYYRLLLTKLPAVG